MTIRSRWKSGPRLLWVVGAGLALALLIVPAAHASCVSSTASTQQPPFADPANDAQGDAGLGVSAPEISSVEVSIDGACNLTVNPTLTNRTALDPNDSLFISMDTDGNAATGDATAEGADRFVLIYPGLPVELWAWNAAILDYDFLGNVPATGIAGFTATLDQLGTGTPGTRIGIFVDALFDDTGQGITYIDNAPDLGALAYRFPVDFASPPPPPPPPPPAPPPPASPAPASAAPASPAPAAQQGKSKPAGCVVPKVKRLSVAKAKKKLKQAGCKFKVRGKGRVKSTSPAAGSRTAETVIVRAKKKRARK